jgi:hypothetical protein
MSFLIASSEEFKALLLLRRFSEDALFHSTLTRDDTFFSLFENAGTGKGTDPLRTPLDFSNRR